MAAVATAADAGCACADRETAGGDGISVFAGDSAFTARSLTTNGPAITIAKE